MVEHSAANMHLEGRGTTYVHDVTGPPGAPTLLMLHGIGATAGMAWSRLFEMLGQRYRVLALDHRGHGRGIRSQDFSLEDCADDAAAVVRARCDGQVVVMGHSMGGAIAAHVVDRHPQLARGLVLSATAARFAPDTWQARAVTNMIGASALLARGIPSWMHRRFGQQMQLRHGPEWGERLRDEFGNSDPATIIRAARACGHFDGKPIYRRMDLPIAMVITTRDTTVATPRQRKLAKLAGAKVFEADTHHTGHMFDVDAYSPALLGALAHVVG